MHTLSPKPDSFYHTEQKMALGYQNPFYLKQAHQKQQSLYNGKILLEKHDPPAVYDSEETLQLAQEIRLKMKQLNKEIKPANYAKINQLSEVFISQKAKSREELYFSNTSKMASVSNTISKPISIPNEEFSDDTSTNTLDLVSQKVDNEIVSLEFQVLNYAKENAHLKTTYKNLFDSINGTKLYSVTPLPKNKFIPKVVETNDLSNPVTSNSAPSTKESKVMKNNKVIARGMFRINPYMTSKEDKFLPINKARASVRTKLITTSQPHVITKKDVNSDLHGLSSTRIDNNTKT
ncbi:hypothetical protein Tco_1225928 [Tanacetum coccineum]